ncbi:MAG: universal stress protein [Actinomycetaceae bacterium]|nr:universal stress protein [Actinomycetaceae bacterium]
MSVRDVVACGVDGSRESLEAAEWAAERAKASGWELQIVCAYALPSYTAASMDSGFAAVDDDAIEASARAVVEEAAAHVADTGVRVTTLAQQGDPTGVLVDLSRSVRLVVVGTRGGGGFADRLLGATSSALPAYAHCPVVVVPRHEEGSRFVPVQRIVAGVDGSNQASQALSSAVAEAVAWGAELTAVETVPMASSAGALAWLPPAVDRSEILRDVRDQLRAACAKASEGTDVDVRSHALDGNAAMLLAEFSTAVDLVVVGSRGRGGVRGLLLGSTSQSVLAHSMCPVMVVPSRSKDYDEAPRPKWRRR